MKLEIPTRAFFNFAFACPYRAEPPVVDGDLKDWDERWRVPELSELEGEEPFADLYLAWNEAGLYLGLEVRGKAALEVVPNRPLKGDGLQVWIDTRDVRNAHRASRYCHHFVFLPVGAGKGKQEPSAGQLRIRRARAQDRPCDPSQIRVASRVMKTGYRMEAHLPAEVLKGFDPEENRRLGFTYVLRDRKLGRQYWTADESLPVSYDPSLWGTVELVREQ